MNRTINWRALAGPAFGLVVAGMVLAGCASSESDSTTTDTPAITTATTAAATTTTAATTATATPTAAERCVACHTDEAALQVLAVEPPAMEVLSEGEG